MTGERINLADVRKAAEAYAVISHRPTEPRTGVTPDDVLALVEAVEAANALAANPFGHLEQRLFYTLRETLARFDFGPSS